MDQSEVLKVKAIFFTILASIAGIAFFWLPWVPKMDFDVTGFMYALGNLPRMTALVGFLAWGALAASFWLRLRNSLRRS
jgi:hypothetical protein